MSTTCSRRSIIVALAVIFVIAALLRFWNLELRPPHHDEGVNGWFTENILRDGYYAYDPKNYHGPLYFYLLVASRAVFGFGLWQLRLPGALIGLAACFIPLLVRRRIGWPAALAACAVLATSPTLVYYARYAIHETLLAALGLLAAACMLRWADSGRGGWLIGLAACVGAMIATKETTLLFLAPAGAWLAGESLVESIRARRFLVLGHGWTGARRALPIAVAMAAVMAVIHVLAYTAAFKAPGSVLAQLHRSIEAYAVWSHTGTEQGGHVKAACYYIHLATRYELVLYGLAVAGTVLGFRERVIRSTGLVGFAMLALYSAIPYKMPWLPMSWLALLAIPAGYGALAAVRLARHEVTPRMPAAIAIGSVLVPAIAITWRSSFHRPADAREQLAYVHTDADYNRWFPFVAQAAKLVGTRQVLIAVDSDTTWPMAWSLRPYPHTHWRADGNEHVIIVAEKRAAAVESRLKARYLKRQYRVRDSADPVFIYLRADVFEQRLSPRGWIVMDKQPGATLADRSR